MNPLQAYFESNPGRQIHKWTHYFEIYHRHFERFRGRGPTIVEIGVQHGGSLQMWKHYFGAGTKIVGVDVDERCKGAEEEGVEVWIGSQDDPGFLARLTAAVQPIDVLIDDGGHTMDQMTVSFKNLFGAVRNDGVYLVEDLHTCYWKEYGGGYRHHASFVEYAKGLVDQLNAWHSRDQNSFSVDAFTRSTHSVHFYDSVVVFEKRELPPPAHRMTGTPQF